MEELLFYSISDKYIEFLREDPILSMVVRDNKKSKFTRKYTGILLKIGKLNYFAPLSSPKNNDYIIMDGNATIRKSTTTIIRIVIEKTESRDEEFLGTIRLSGMIPVPDTELSNYIFEDEQDINYKKLVQKQYIFIKTNANDIIKKSNVLYKQKINEKRYYNDLIKKPKYLDNTVNFTYAEYKYMEFINLKS